MSWSLFVKWSVQAIMHRFEEVEKTNSSKPLPTRVPSKLSCQIVRRTW